MPMAPEARRFPKEVEGFLRDFNLWDGLSPAARETLMNLGVKLEPFAVPQRAAPGQNDLFGFECLAYGAGGRAYGDLLRLARDQKIDDALLGLTLFRVALLTANALVDVTGSTVLGSVWSELFVSINVDAAMLHSSVFIRLLDQIPKPPFQVFLEASENLQPEHVTALRRILDRHESWLKLALDDSDELAHDTRELLRPRVALVKADGRYVRKLYRDRDKAPDFMLSRLLELRQPGKPFVAEGIEHEDLKLYLKQRWDVSANGELWMQGYHIHVPAPWGEALAPIHDEPAQPQGYALRDEVTAIPTPRLFPALRKPLHPIIERTELVEEFLRGIKAGENNFAFIQTPGVGKTTVVANLICKPEIMREFPDGILWAHLGQDPNIGSELTEWAKLLGLKDGDLKDCNSHEDIGREIKKTIGNARLLLIADDVWTTRAGECFAVGGGALCAYFHNETRICCN